MVGGVLAAGLVVRDSRQVLQVALLSGILSLAPLLYSWGRDYDRLQTLFLNPPAYFILIGAPVAAIYGIRMWITRKRAA
jgi:hypothetical protein